MSTAITQIQAYLKSNDKNSVEVCSYETRTLIDKDITQEYLDKNHEGSFENYLKRLTDQNFSKFSVTEFKRSGNARIRNNPTPYLIETKSSSSSSGVASQAHGLNGHAQVAGMNAGANFGLSGAQFLETFSDARRYSDTKTELTATKEENKRLLDKIEKLKDDLNTERFNQNTKPSAVDKLVEALASNPEIVMNGLAALKGGGGQQQALSAPSMEGVSEYAQSLIQGIIQVKPDDAMLERLNALFIIYTQGANELIDRYESIFKDFQQKAQQQEH